MSIAGKPSKLTSAAVWLGLTLALLLGIAGSTFAQSGPGVTDRVQARDLAAGA
jgi:hypothetical protein